MKDSSEFETSEDKGVVVELPREEPTETEESAQDSGESTKEANGASASGVKGSDAEFEESVTEKLPAPPKGVWPAGATILDGVCQVLPFSSSKLYAEGGVGYVQRVRRRDWNIDLVVKSPKPGVAESERGKQNFERECQTWIELGLHPNIVSCYFVRRIDGIPRLFAEFAPDGTLQDWILSKRLYEGTEEEILARIIDVSIQFAWGLEHAHRQGLVHLDVKPGNVMTSGATIKVTDFGLSKTTQDSEDRDYGSTNHCDGMTPAYCSPEQYEAFQYYQEQRKAGRRGAECYSSIQITKKTDIWSWAISVLAMFHGRSPCKLGGQTAAEVFEVFLQTPRPEGRPAIPEAMTELLRHCFQKDPLARPESMQAVADRLVRIYEEQFGTKYPRRQQKDSSSSAESLSNRAISLLDLNKQADAEALLQRAASLAPSSAQIVYNHTLLQWRSGHITDVEATRRIERLTHRRDTDGNAHFVSGLLQMERGNIKGSASEFARALELLPERFDIKRSYQRTSDLLPYDAVCSNQYLLRRGENGVPPAFYIDTNGTYLLFELATEELVLFNLRTGQSISQLTRLKGTSGLRVKSGERVKVAVSRDYRLALYFEGSERAVLEATEGQESNGRSQMVFTLASWSTNVNTGAYDAELSSLGYSDLDLAVAEDSSGRWLAVGSHDSQVCLWERKTRRLWRTFVARGGAIEALWFDPQRRYVATICNGVNCQIWRVTLICRHSRQYLRSPHLLCVVNSSEEIFERETELASVLSQAEEARSRGDLARYYELYRQAERSEGSETVLSSFLSTFDMRLTRNRLREMTPVFKRQSHEGAVSSTACSWNGSFLASCGKDAAVRVWRRSSQSHSGERNVRDVEDRERWSATLELTGHRDWVRTLALSHDNRTLCSGSWDQRVILWDLATGKRLRTLPERFRSIAHLSYAPDDRTLATCTDGGSVSLWDLCGHSALLTLNVGSGESRVFCFNHTGRLFATGGESGIVRLWTGRSKLPRREFAALPSSVLSLTWTYDGRRLYAGCADGKIYELDLYSDASGYSRALSGHLGEVCSVCVLADARWLVSSSKDSSFKVWDLTKFTEACRVAAPEGALTTLATDLRGTTLYAGDERGNLYGWRFDWDYSPEGPVLSDSQRRARVQSVYLRHWFNSERVRLNLSPSAYYGTSTSPWDTVGRSEPSEDLARKTYDEGIYRGLNDMSFEETRELIRSVNRTCEEFPGT
ncbi:MAG: protein kinase [Planctomycetia bacterium]|nr:protein kinase [Planctomycetia bacterium]